MKKKIICKSVFLLFGLLFCLGVSNVCAAPAAEEWIDIEVVVNVLDGADAGNVDDAIKKANEAFKKAKIRLVKKATDPNAKGDTNGDGGLDRAERDKTRKEGQKALDKAVGAGKGIKIDVANDVDINDAGTVGVAIHRTPVIIVEPETDVNELGKTIAHEIGHVLTLEDDLYGPNDVNNLMYGYTGSGTDLDVNDINEIRQDAKIRGTAYFIVPKVLSSSAAVPDGINYSIDGFGAILDDFNDVFFYDPSGLITDPNDPTIQYADIGEITVFADEPFDPNSVFRTTIQLGQLPDIMWRIDSFFDITYHTELGQPLGRAHIELQYWCPISATWFDANGMPTTETVAVLVNVNSAIPTESEYLGNPHQKESHNKTLQVKIPVRLIQSGLVGTEQIIVTCNSQHLDRRYGPNPSNMIQLMDQASPFKFGLSQPCHCPSLSFALNNSPAVPDPNGNINISGCGFEPGISGRLYVESATRLIADRPLMTSADGGLADAIGCSVLNPAEDGWIRVCFQPEYYGPPEAAPEGAAGYFKYCPGGEILGDLNSDCAVNLLDFAIFANDWLKGAMP